MLATKELSLYDIQEDIVSACRDAFRYDKKIILMAATGLGKTVIATWMIKSAYRKNLRCLFVCDRVSLIDQTSKVFSDYGLLHGIFQAENPMYAPELSIQIGSIQTLARRKQREYDFIVFDEIHTFFKAHEKIMEFNRNAFVLGLSATPFSKGLGKYFNKHIEPVPMKELINQGYLCDFEIYGPDTIDVSKVRTRAGEYREDDLEREANKPELVADVLKTWLRLAKTYKTIVFAVNVAHGRHLEKTFVKQGIKAFEVNGYMRKEGEDGANQIIQDFRDNKFDVLISVEMLVKGFDVPDVQCVVFATATKSPIKWIQACGRGLRAHPSKDKCLILDHGSNTERLGFPDEYDFTELDDGKHQRSKNKKKEREDPLPKKCTSCDFIKPVRVRKCPACGVEPKYIQEVETKEGELKKLKRKNNKNYSKQEKQSFLSQLNQYAMDKGYNKGWASHKYREKFGVWPRNLTKTGLEPVGEEVKKFIIHLNIKHAKSKNLKS